MSSNNQRKLSAHRTKQPISYQPSSKKEEYLQRQQMAKRTSGSTNKPQSVFRKKHSEDNDIQHINDQVHPTIFPYQRINHPYFESCIEEVSRDDDEYSQSNDVLSHQALSLEDLPSYNNAEIYQYLQQQQEPVETQHSFQESVKSLGPINIQDGQAVLQDSSRASSLQNLAQQNHFYSTEDSNRTATSHSSNKPCDLYGNSKSQTSDKKKALYLRLRSQYQQNENSESLASKENNSAYNESNLSRRKASQEKSQSLNSSTVSAQQNPLFSDPLVQAEIEKWKKFGYLVAESYDEQKKEQEKLKNEREKDKKIISALKDQVQKLKQILSAKDLDESVADNDHKTIIESLQQENNQLKQVQQEKESLLQEVEFQGEVVSQLSEKLQKAKSEINQLKVQVQRTQAQPAQQVSSSTSDYSLMSKDHVTFYKKMSHQHLRECSQLADELICLRSDVDKQDKSSIKPNSHSFNMERRGFSQGRGSNSGWPTSQASSANKRGSFSAIRKDSWSKRAEHNTPSHNIQRVNGSHSLPFSPKPDHSKTNMTANTTGKINTSRNGDIKPTFSPIQDRNTNVQTQRKQCGAQQYLPPQSRQRDIIQTLKDEQRQSKGIKGYKEATYLGNVLQEEAEQDQQRKIQNQRKYLSRQDQNVMSLTKTEFDCSNLSETSSHFGEYTPQSKFDQARGDRILSAYQQSDSNLSSINNNLSHIIQIDQTSNFGNKQYSTSKGLNEQSEDRVRQTGESPSEVMSECSINTNHSSVPKRLQPSLLVNYKSLNFRN